MNILYANLNTEIIWIFEVCSDQNVSLFIYAFTHIRRRMDSLIWLCLNIKVPMLDYIPYFFSSPKPNLNILGILCVTTDQ